MILIITRHLALLSTTAGASWSELDVSAFSSKISMPASSGTITLTYLSGLLTSSGIYLTVKAAQDDSAERLVFRGQTLTTDWINIASVPVTQNISYVDPDGDLFVPYSHGLLKKSVGGDWRNISGPIVDLSSANSLVPCGSALVYATRKDIWYSFDKGESWKAMAVAKPASDTILSRTLVAYVDNMVLFATAHTLFVGVVSGDNDAPSDVWTAEFRDIHDVSQVTVEIDGQPSPDASITLLQDSIRVRGGPTSSELSSGAHSIIVKAKQGASQINQVSYVWKENVKEWLGFGPYRKSYAVVAAVSDYNGTGFADLPMAAVQAHKVAATLAKQGFEIKELPNATKEALEGYVLGELRRKLDRRDRVLIYFGGHGYTLSGARGEPIGYLATRGVMQNSPELGLPMSRIESEYSQLLGAGQVLFVLDACFSGLASPRQGGPSEEDLKIFQRYGQIRNLTASGERAVLTAGRKGDVALDVNGGIFTSAFLDGISGAADYDHNGIVTLVELILYVQTRVQNEANLRGYTQVPQLSQLSEFGEGQMVFMYR